MRWRRQQREAARARAPRLRISLLSMLDNYGEGVRRYHDHADAASFLSYFRLSRDMFSTILDGFDGWLTNHDTHSARVIPHAISATRVMDPPLVLAMVLRWLVSGAGVDDLAVWFLVSRASVSRYRNSGLIALFHALKGLDECRIAIPRDVAYLRGCADATEAYCSRINGGLGGLRNVVGAIDGWTTPCSGTDSLRLPVTVTARGRSVRVDPMFNGKDRRPVFKHLLLWGTDGCCWSGVFGRLGSTHDAALYASMRPHLDRAMQAWRQSDPDARFHYLADSAFPADPSQLVVRALTQPEIEAMPSEQLRVWEVTNPMHYKVRNLAEWGNSQLGNTFGVLGQIMDRYDAVKQGTVFQICVRLFNFRVRRLGIGEIYTVFNDDNGAARAPVGT